MDASRFDRLTKALSTGGTRRRLLALLTALPVAGPLTAFLVEAAEAKRSQRHPSRRHTAHGQGSGKSQEQGHARKCKPEPKTKTCKGKCGTIKNNCKKKVDCGPCKCKPKCKACQTCNKKTGKCKPVANETACGSGKVCCAGQCVTGDCQTCTASRPCPLGEQCDGGECRPCDVCEDGCAFDTVQDAIDAASNGDTIRICAGTYGGDILIDTTKPNSLTLIGAGKGANSATNTILQGTGTDSVVTIDARTVALQRVRITGGKAFVGGGVATTDGDVTMTACTVTNNTAVNGGGLDNRGDASPGKLTMIDCTVETNTATNRGGGIHNDGSMATLELTRCAIRDNDAQVGGGIQTDTGAATLTDCSVTINEATEGGGIDSLGSTLILDNSDVTANTATGAGGGIHHFGGNTLTLRNTSSVSRNEATNGGGVFSTGSGNPAFTLDESSVTGNIASNQGGGIFHRDPGSANVLHIIDGTVTGNEAQGGAGSGGGIYNEATIVVDSGTLAPNDPDDCVNVAPNGEGCP